uniref:NADH-ubiquinone oxidoreductase chain 3 n=1 Tax=Vaejovis mexicanus smithi TaxID=1562928 RepID=A0A343AXZ1_VAEMS|nr:NADH dehydrogenase subunit 3 [Vaejovis smithi]APW29075.1 NADH dehydrogenase subunit 3 [Vaejovis smithi]
MLLFSIFFVFMLSFIVMMVGIFFSKKVVLDKEKGSSFECGFDPLNSSRLSFSLQFFLIGIIFLIFDVEIALMLPAPLCILNSVMFLFVLGMFLAILLFGLYFEWNQGILEWMK